MANMTPHITNCPRCHHADPALAQSGVMLLMHDAEHDVLRLFLNRALDDKKCDACKHPLGVRPTFAYVAVDRKLIHFVLGSSSHANRERVLSMLSGLGTQFGCSVEPQELAEIDMLRKEIANQLAQKLKVIEELLNAHSSGRGIHFALENWRRLTSSSFAAALLVDHVPQLRSQIVTSEDSDSSSATLTAILAPYQCAVWCRLVDSWSRADDLDNTCLEDYLKTHIAERSLIPGAAEMALRILDSEEIKPDLSARATYVLQAVRASICAASGMLSQIGNKWANEYLEFELVSQLSPESAGSSSLAVSPERAASTISYTHAWDGVASLLGTYGAAEGVIKALGEAVAKAGYKGLVRDVISEAVIHEDKVGPILDADPLIAVFRELHEAGVEFTIFMAGVTQYTKPLAENRRMTELEAIAKEIGRLYGTSNEVLARIDCWLGRCYKEMREPRKFLSRIGEEPREWESALSDETRVMLWTERSNALRLSGKAFEALKQIQEVVATFPEDGEPSDRRVAERNLAILLRETGAPEAAIPMFESLLKSARGLERQQLLESVSIAYTEAGHYEKALSSMKESLSFAIGPWARHAPKLKAATASVLAINDQYAEAAEMLMTIDDQQDPIALLPIASAWLTILSNEQSLPSGSEQKIATLHESMKSAIEASEAQGDFQSCVGLAQLFARLHEFVAAEFQGVQEAWERVFELAEKYKMPHGATELISLAIYAYATEDLEAGRRYLAHLPASFAFSSGGAIDLSSISSAVADRVRARFRNLTTMVLKSGDVASDLRLVSELRRDVVGRARRMRMQSMIPLALASSHGFNSAVAQSLSTPDGQVAIVEWWDSNTHFGCIVTTIEPDGASSCRPIPIPKLSFVKLARRIRTRLSNWHPKRLGDPFDFEEWRQIEEWVNVELGAILDSNCHVVFLEHDQIAGIPWHVAARKWTSSYAASWSSLVYGWHRGARPIKALGLIFVPRAFESQGIMTAFDASLQRTSDLSKQLAVSLIRENSSRSCDRGAFCRIAESVDVLKILCHGFVDAADREVALMLAHEGQLPHSLSVACDSEVGRRHRLGWRECEVIKRAPDVVFAGACSAGVSHVTGIGDRLGLFAGLHSAGTRAIVGPRWDVFAKEELPILDHAIELYCRSGGVGLGRAVQQACLAAERSLPVWRAWNLTIEGDWR